MDMGSGFVAIEAGYLSMIGAGRDQLSDTFVGYLNIGMSVSKEFGGDDDYEPLRLGPKIGFGYGEVKSKNEDRGLLDLLLKLRYTFRAGNMVQPYVDVGPGYMNYGGRTAEIEAGSGIDFRFGEGSCGFNAQYKEVFGSDYFNRAATFLATLGYHF